MSRTAKGTVVYVPGKNGKPGHWKGRLSCLDETRPWVDPLGSWPNSKQGRCRAKETIAAMNEELRARGLSWTPPSKRRAAPSAPPAEGETFDDYAKRWFAEREARGLSSLSTDRSRVRVHVSPVVGSKRMVDIASADLRAVCLGLDETARSNPDFSWRTGVKVWGLVTKLFSDAVASKVEDLRVLTANPCIGVRGPDRGELKGKQWLRPLELLQLVSCPEVPLRWRRLYVLASYLYTRPGELAALEWGDVQLEQGYVSIHQALNLEKGELKATKTGTSRKVPIPAALLPLLKAMHAEAKGKGRVVQNTHDNKKADHGMPPTEDLAATLRTHLERAGVKRADLFADRATSKRMTFYDLRASGITWEVLDGTEHVRIMQRAGHRNFSTTQGYIREAEALGENVGQPFGPLPESLLSADAIEAADEAEKEIAPPDESSRESSQNAFVGGFLFGSSMIPAGLLASPRGFEKNTKARRRTRAQGIPRFRHQDARGATRETLRRPSLWPKPTQSKPPLQRPFTALRGLRLGTPSRR